MSPSASTNNHLLTGWLFVLAQAVLFIALLALPSANHWPVPGRLRIIGMGLVVGGLLLAAAAIVRLGSSATPTPVPKPGGELATTGLYRFSRHPIYTGVLITVVGLVLRSGSVVTLAVGALTVAFFTLKARWEERRLSERYGGYAAYAATTGRFFPRFW